MPSIIVQKCARILAEKGLTIAFVESATAGRMCSEFALTEYSGRILQGGICCYNAFIKENILNIPFALIEECTAESAEVTCALAINGAKLLNADIVIAVTGLTTPGGSESESKPVGTMYLYIKMKNESLSYHQIFFGESESIILQTIDKAAELVLEIIKKLNQNTS